MKHIAKPLKNEKNNLFKSFTWKDILFGMIMYSIFFTIIIPLIINKEILAAIILILIATLITGILLMKFGDMKLYLWIYNFIRFQFTKTKDFHVDYINKCKDNVIELSDMNSNSYEYYRIIGKDITLLDKEDIEQITDKLAIFFSENKELNLLKVDGKVNFNSVTMYLKKLNNNKYTANEINEQIKILNNLKSNFVTSNHPKYFISLPHNDNVDNSETIQKINKLLNDADLNLVKINNDELNDIKRKLYFNNANVTEYRKYLVIKENDIDPLSDMEMKLKESIEIDVPFTFRNNSYKYDSFNSYHKLDENFEWIKCEDPFDDLQPATSYTTFIALKSLPSTVNYGWLSSIFNMKEVDANLKISNIDIENIEKLLTKTIDNCEEAYENLLYKNVVKARKIENELNAYKYLSNALSNGKEIKSISCILKIEANNEKKLLEKVKEVFKFLKREGFDFSRLEFNQFDALKEFFANDSKGLNFLNPMECLDEILGYSYPFTEQEIIDENGLYFGLDENKTPTFIDWKKMDEFKNSSSMILLGKTGSGKSTTIKRILKNQILSNEYRIFIIDPENEYGEFIENFNGEVININNGNRIINPFELIWNSNKKDLYEAINDKMIFVSNFLKIVFESCLSPSELSWLEQNIHELYLSSKGNKEITFSDIYKYLKKVNKNQYNNVIDQVGYYSHAAKGNKAFLWDSCTNINLNKGYIVFEFRDLLSKSCNSNIASAQMFLVLQFLNNVVLSNREDDHKYINIVIDEAHLLMKPKYLQIVEFLNEMYKRIRKYNGMISLITQNIADFYHPTIKEYTTSLINNSFWIIVHAIKPQEIPMLNELMAEQGNLKKSEIEFLTSPKQGQCLLIFNKTRTKINVQK